MLLIIVFSVNINQEHFVGIQKDEGPMIAAVGATPKYNCLDDTRVERIPNRIAGVYSEQHEFTSYDECKKNCNSLDKDFKFCKGFQYEELDGGGVKCNFIVDTKVSTDFSFENDTTQDTLSNGQKVCEKMESQIDVGKTSTTKAAEAAASASTTTKAAEGAEGAASASTTTKAAEGAEGAASAANTTTKAAEGAASAATTTTTKSAEEAAANENANTILTQACIYNGDKDDENNPPSHIHTGPLGSENCPYHRWKDNHSGHKVHKAKEELLFTLKGDTNSFYLDATNNNINFEVTIEFYNSQTHSIEEALKAQIKSINPKNINNNSDVKADLKITEGNFMIYSKKQDKKDKKLWIEGLLKLQFVR